MSLYSFNRDGRLRRYSAYKLKMVGRKGRKWIESVSVDDAVDIRFSYQRSTNGRAHTLGDDRFRAQELSVGSRVLRKDSYLLPHHFLGDRAANRQFLRQAADIRVSR